MITVYELIYNFLFIRKTIYHILHYFQNNRFCFSLCSICLSLLLPLEQSIANCCFFWHDYWIGKINYSCLFRLVTCLYSSEGLLLLSFYFQSPRKCLLGIFFSECYRLLLTIYFQILCENKCVLHCILSRALWETLGWHAVELQFLAYKKFQFMPQKKCFVVLGWLNYFIQIINSKN